MQRNKDPHIERKWVAVAFATTTRKNALRSYGSLSRFLEGRANGVLRAGRKAGAYGDRTCVTVTIAVMIDAIVHVAVNSLDVLLAALGATVLLFVHFKHLP